MGVDSLTVAIRSAVLFIAVALIYSFTATLLQPQMSDRAQAGANSKNGGESKPFLRASRSTVLDEIRSKSEAGDMKSQYQLAIILFEEAELHSDVPLRFEALGWLIKSADQEYTPAVIEMGSRYLAGSGVVQNFAKAAELFSIGAKHGSPSAMYHLGNMASSGLVSDMPLFEAYAWLNVASARGEARAETARRLIFNQLTKGELDQGQRLSSELDEALPRDADTGRWQR